MTADMLFFFFFNVIGFAFIVPITQIGLFLYLSLSAASLLGNVVQSLSRSNRTNPTA